MNPVFISLWCSSLLTQINQLKEPIPSDDSMCFRYILTMTHMRLCKESIFLQATCKLKLWNLFEKLTMLFLLRVVHLPPAKYDKSILNSTSNKSDKTEVKRVIIQNPTCSCMTRCLMQCRDLQLHSVQTILNHEALQHKAYSIILYNYCISGTCIQPHIHCLLKAFKI